MEASFTFFCEKQASFVNTVLMRSNDSGEVWLSNYVRELVAPVGKERLIEVEIRQQLSARNVRLLYGRITDELKPDPSLELAYSFHCTMKSRIELPEARSFFIEFCKGYGIESEYKYDAGYID
jgi:hypothetical protein